MPSAIILSIKDFQLKPIPQLKLNLEKQVVIYLKICQKSNMFKI